MKIFKNSKKPPKICGERQRGGQRRILSGYNAVEGDNKWMVALSIKNSISCGASIITENFVITGKVFIPILPFTVVSRNKGLVILSKKAE